MKDKLSKEGPSLVDYVRNVCNSCRLLGTRSINTRRKLNKPRR